jgi:dynein heavy chain 2
LDFAADAVGPGRYRDLAMGGGQQQAAAELLTAAARDGDWLCLKNLHLVVAWLPTLEKTLASLAPSMHPNFRLWLTTEPHPLFPPILLQSSLKVTFEAPPGIKKNLQRTLTSWGKDFLDHGVAASPGGSSPAGFAPPPPGDLPRARSPLLFLLAWFHAVVQERRTYLPQGWSKAYEFSVGDLRAGAMVLDAVARRAGPVDFELVHGLMEDALYGGRVDNPSDLRVLRTYVAQLYNKEMVSAQGGELCARVRMPTAFAFDDLLQWAQELPDEDSPTLFGLPESIQRALQRSLSAAVGSQLRSLSVSGAAALKFDRERWRASLSPLLEVWAALMEGQTLEPKARPKGGEKGMSPTDQFVVFENEAAAQLCVFVDGQIAALKAVVFGTALLTPSIQAVGAALLQGEVPLAWEKKWEGPSAAAAWLALLGRKKRALSQWADAVAAGRLLAAPRNLADLFNPGTFLNALRQQAARRLRVPLEETKLVSAWDAKKLAGCDLVLTADGFWVENAVVGASNGHALSAVAAQAPEVTRAPPLSLAFVALAHPEPYRSEADTLAVPVYLSPSREQHLVDLTVPVRGDPATWVLAGVAFLLSEK